MPYGDRLLDLDIPKSSLAYVIDAGEVPPVEDALKEIRRALSSPISHPGIKSLAKPGDKVVILGDDMARPTPCHLLVPPILDELNQAGVRDSDVTIIVSTGTHRSLTEEEFKAKFGEEAASRVRVVNHDYRDERGLHFLGRTPLGTPIWLNREFIQANYRIGLGGVIPHPFGWGGGGKIVEPGICGAETIFKVHRLAASYRIHDLIGEVENPVRREIDEVARKAGLDFIVNTVIDAEGRLVGVFAGNLVEAHREGIKLAEQIYRPSVPFRTDIAVAGSPGFSVNIDYWQAVKGVLAASCFVKHGGTVILATPCYEGIPVSSHLEVLELGALPYKEAIKKIDEGGFADPSLPGFISINGQAREKAEILIFSDHLSEVECEGLGLRKVGSLQGAVDEALARHGRGATVGVLRHFEVFPRVEGERTGAGLG
ncbi:MAG: nickel-dependent lactate racemase [Candidatus Bathyarchaeia archaeon]